VDPYQFVYQVDGFAPRIQDVNFRKVPNPEPTPPIPNTDPGHGAGDAPLGEVLPTPHARRLHHPPPPRLRLVSRPSQISEWTAHFSYSITMLKPADFSTCLLHASGCLNPTPQTSLLGGCSSRVWQNESAMASTLAPGSTGRPVNPSTLHPELHP